MVRVFNICFLYTEKSVQYLKHFSQRAKKSEILYAGNSRRINNIKIVKKLYFTLPELTYSFIVIININTFRS